MADPAVVTKALNGLLEGVRDRTLAVDLPMACGTPALLRFETFPTAHAEQEALLRWRLRQEEHLTAPDVTLRWHAVPVGEPPSTAMSVMVVAIRQSILDQYHQVCEAAQLLPVAMGWSTFHLLKLARSAFSTAGHLYIAHRTAEMLIVFAVQHGRPVRLRVKPIRRTNVDVKTDVLQTLQFFAQADSPGHADGARTTTLYLVEEGLPRDESLSSHDATEVWTMSEHLNWTVSVTRARWATAPIMSTVAAPDHPPFGALAAVLAA